mgnify:CR=1 FL=1
MYSEQKIESLLQTAKAARLIIPEEMLACERSALAKICNGVGSQSMPEWARNAGNVFFGAIEASAAIHDYMYEFSDGSLYLKEKADDIFLLNGIDEIYHKYGWWNWKRYAARLKLMAAYDILRAVGNRAYITAYIKRRKNEL